MPPSIVLEVLRILNAEKDLRESTREAEQAREQMKTEAYSELAESLLVTQEDIADRTEAVLEQIKDLPEGEKKYAKQIAQISEAVVAMWDAADILSQPNTGPDAIGAETEAIECLLRAKRAKPGAKPGDSAAGKYQTGVDGGLAAMELEGDSDEDQAKVNDTYVGQSTGRAESDHPEEFKSGLDRYFELLEKVQ